MLGGRDVLAKKNAIQKLRRKKQQQLEELKNAVSRAEK
jgi:hypothetical protein